jgi:hypothetical protein
MNAAPDLDPIAELERIVRRDSAAVLEIHALLLEYQCRNERTDPDNPQHAKEIEHIHSWLMGEVERLERDSGRRVKRINPGRRKEEDQ